MCIVLQRIVYSNEFQYLCYIEEHLYMKYCILIRLQIVGTLCMHNELNEQIRDQAVKQQQQLKLAWTILS